MKKTSGQECLRFEFLAQQVRAQLSTSIQICVGHHLDGLTPGMFDCFKGLTLKKFTTPSKNTTSAIRDSRDRA